MTQAAVAKYGSAAIPEAEHRIEPTSQSKLDEALAILQDHKKEWAALDVDERIDLLEELRDGVMRVAERWVDASVEAKGLTAGSAQEADEWLGGVSLVVRNLSLLIEACRAPPRTKVFLDRMVEIDDSTITGDGQQYRRHAVLYRPHVFDRTSGPVLRQTESGEALATCRVKPRCHVVPIALRDDAAAMQNQQSAATTPFREFEHFVQAVLLPTL